MYLHHCPNRNSGWERQTTDCKNCKQTGSKSFSLNIEAVSPFYLWKTKQVTYIAILSRNCKHDTFSVIGKLYSSRITHQTGCHAYYLRLYSPQLIIMYILAITISVVIGIRQTSACFQSKYAILDEQPSTKIYPSDGIF